MKILLLLCITVVYCKGFRILVVFPMAGRSHDIMGDAIVKLLLEAGHDVTTIMAFQRDPHPNLTQVIADNTKYFHQNSIKIHKLINKQMNLVDLDFITAMFVNISINTVEQEVVQALFRDTSKKFDAVVAEWMFSEMYSAISALYQCQLIWFSTLDPHWQVMRLIDETMNPAYNGHCHGFNVQPFSLWNRIEEIWHQIEHYQRIRRFTALEKDAYQRSIVPLIKQRGYSVPEYDDLIYSASLMLGNSHVSSGIPARLPQNYKPIGGYHIQNNLKPLTGELKEILDNATNGLIYFSMGTNLKSKDIPKNLKTGLLNMFSELNQTVLWKLEEALPNLPKNVHIVSWAPQPAILAHPNTVLFISHGGLLSTTEAIHFGKPIIGIPVYADQFTNVAKVMHKGYGRKVDLSYNLVTDLRAEIKEILGNPNYTEKAKEWSFIYHDRPVSPGKELVHWVEHVIKTKGASHLRSPALLVPLYQKLYLDVIVIILGVLYLSVEIFKLVLCTISRSFKIKIH